MANMGPQGGSNRGTGKWQDPRPYVTVGGIDFTHEQSNVSVDTKGRYTEHKVIGNVTVKQKLGEEPTTASVEGVCTTDEAKQIDELVYDEEVELISNRKTSMVYVDSTSTSPLSDGGALNLNEEFEHSFTIELTLVEESEGMSALQWVV